VNRELRMCQRSFHGSNGTAHAEPLPKPGRNCTQGMKNALRSLRDKMKADQQAPCAENLSLWHDLINKTRYNTPNLRCRQRLRHL